MEIEVAFESIGSMDFKQNINYMGTNCKLDSTADGFNVLLDGENKETNISILRDIWEIDFLYNGFFRKPLKYSVDGHKENVKLLFFLPFYKTSKIWVDCSRPLVSDEYSFEFEVLKTYSEVRNRGRASNSMLKAIFNSFYYLHSEAYEHININHTLAMFLNICDGFISNTTVMSKNIKANISAIIGKSLDSKSVKNMADLLGIGRSKMYDALLAERNEIDHYIIQKGSLSQYVETSGTCAGDYILWYFTFVVELALRVAILKYIGLECDEHLIEDALNQINDWAILGGELQGNCQIPANRVIQELRKKGIYFK